jgi:tRNA A-37 threonylcarbamoyl transferase component Bud32
MMANSFQQGYESLPPLAIGGISLEEKTTNVKNYLNKTAAHKFQHQSILAPTTCLECSKMIYLKGNKCKECLLYCHEKCLPKVQKECGLSKEQLKSKRSAERLHSFQKIDFESSPANCFICDSKISSVKGLKCSKCSNVYHEACFEKYPSECRIKVSPITSASFESILPLLECNSYKERIYDGTEIQRKRISPNPNDTLMRLSRNRLHGQQRNGIHVQKLFEQEPASPFNGDGHDNLLATISIPNAKESKNRIVSVENFRRKCHEFRGHKYCATYLDISDKCDICFYILGDNGRQCYQCKLCDFKCHKKCYTKSKPCLISIGSLDPLNSERDEVQTALVRRSINRRYMEDFKGKDFVEDFSDELVSMEKSLAERLMDDYVIEDYILGSGQYGVVKKGHYHFNCDEKIAVKVISKKRFAGKLLSRKNKNDLPTILERELDIFKKLDHPGIIRMHNYVDLPDQTLLIMDFAPGGDLLGYIMEQGKVQESEASFIFYQVVNALKYLHDHDIIHRDMKPENLLLCDGENETKIVKIADFGFARMMESVEAGEGNSNEQPILNPLHSVVGTPMYMSPEIVDPRVWDYVMCEEKLKKKGYSKSADMWSLGVILYVTLGGVFPFDSEQPILDQILRGDFFFPDEQFDKVTDEAIDLICGLLLVNPFQRLDCDSCLRHVWLSKIVLPVSR